MSLASGCLAVFGLSTLTLWSAIPLGFALHLPIVLTALSSACGAIVGGLAGALLGKRLRVGPFAPMLERAQAAASSKARHLIAKYGAIGLGLLSPAITGSIIAALLGRAFGMELRPLLVWYSVGVLLWAFALTTLGYIGLDAIF